MILLYSIKKQIYNIIVVIFLYSKKWIYINSFGHRFFLLNCNYKIAYNFIANYNNLWSENIISAVVHLDEETPHMHLVYIPVVHIKDSKSGKDINKISCYELKKSLELVYLFWWDFGKNFKECS